MSSLELVGEVPSPYGPLVKIHRDPECEDEELAFSFDMEGMMTMAGIHGKKRIACAIDIKSRTSLKLPITFETFARYGGQKLPYIKIERPEQSIHQGLLSAPDRPSEADELIEASVTMVMDASDWYERAERLDSVLLSWFDDAPGHKSADVAVTLSGLLTCGLEHLCEAEIDNIQSAATYALSSHWGWRAAGDEWLLPVRKTWLKDWLAEHPGFRRLAFNLRKNYRDIPKWMLG